MHGRARESGDRDALQEISERRKHLRTQIPRNWNRISDQQAFFATRRNRLWARASRLWKSCAAKCRKTMEELLKLPGVARKTANVVLGTAFGIASGVVVDTHVLRVSRRLDLTKNVDPKKVEQDLMKVIPHEKWILFSHQLIWHGRKSVPGTQTEVPGMQPRANLLLERQNCLSRSTGNPSVNGRALVVLLKSRD